MYVSEIRSIFSKRIVLIGLKRIVLINQSPPISLCLMEMSAGLPEGRDRRRAITRRREVSRRWTVSILSWTRTPVIFLHVFRRTRRRNVRGAEQYQRRDIIAHFLRRVWRGKLSMSAEENARANDPRAGLTPINDDREEVTRVQQHSTT